MIKEKIPSIEKLSKKEKLILARELWDDALSEEDIDLTEAQKEELDRRIKYAKEHPDEAISWQQVRENVRKKYDH